MNVQEMKGDQNQQNLVLKRIEQSKQKYHSLLEDIQDNQDQFSDDEPNTTAINAKIKWN